MICWLMVFALLAEDPKIVLGVLEEVPGRYVGQQASRGVRVVFQKNGRDWEPFASENAPEVTWTISFSGRRLGQLTGNGTGPVPTVGKRSAEFAGFLGTPVLRPLIADSQAFFKDPDGWKPSQTPAGMAAPVRAEFRKKFPEVSNCATPNDEAKPWAYRDADLRIAKAYSSMRRWSVVEVILDRYRCEDPIDEPFAGQWFALSPGGDVKFIGQGMWLVDAGDYDNDGKSELVFSIDRYDEGGYELFYDDFKGHAVFRFSYH
jgi:hypothetical protein